MRSWWRVGRASSITTCQSRAPSPSHSTCCVTVAPVTSSVHGGDCGEAAQLPDRVDVEREQAARAQVRGGALEQRAPAREVGEVVERVEHADHGVEALAEVEAVMSASISRACGTRARARASICGERSRPVSDGDLRERREDLAAAAAELEQRGGAGGVPAQVAAHARRVGERIASDQRVVVAREVLVGRAPPALSARSTLRARCRRAPDDRRRHAAARTLEGRIHRTPVFSSRSLAERIGRPASPEGGALPADRLVQAARRDQSRRRDGARGARRRRRHGVGGQPRAGGGARLRRGRDRRRRVHAAGASAAKVAATRGYGATVDLESADGARGVRADARARAAERAQRAAPVRRRAA